MVESTRQCIVVVCGDPGGASAVAPVIAALERGERYAVHALAYAQARTTWRARDIAMRELGETTTMERAEDQLGRLDAALVLAGTSVNGIDLEKRFIQAARRLGVPSLAVLDFWSNYVARFANADGCLTDLPDRIAVMDGQARDDMIAEGFPPERLVVTGQPAFDELMAIRDSFTPEKRAVKRRHLGIGPDERLILFASQPLAALYGEDNSSPRYQGYTEQTVLALLVRILESIARRTNQKLVLWIRPHPRENPADLQACSSDLLRTVISTRHDGRDLALAADLVTGMTSVFLVEACLLGCPVVSLQPNLRGTDPLPTNRTGLSRPVYREEETESVLERSLFDASARARPGDAEFLPNATERVLALIERMLATRLVPKVQGSL